MVASFEIDDGEVGVIADGDSSFSGDPEQAGGARAREVDKSRQREPARVDVVEHEGNERLHPGHARRACRIGPLLLVARVRCVIGAEHIDDALSDAVPQGGLSRSP
jgi:hypothetical protein